jgi:peptidyl-prolyl cis-trans isomerase D
MLRYLRIGNKRTKTIWWVLIIVTVVTFVGGFVFLFGAGFDSTRQAQVTGAVGTVNGASISRAEYQTAISEARANYRRQYPQTEPNDQDERVIEVQAWRTLVVQRLMGEQARAAGLGATDREVVLAMQTNPPAMLVTSPAFQTDGKFDPNKYQAAMRNPSNNWSEIEDLMRSQIPVRKLQERLIGSLKIAEPELREMFRNQYEKVSATVLQVPGSSSTTLPAPTDADLQRTYEEYKSRFVSGPRTQLEVLSVPRRLGDEEVRVAHELAASLSNRARGGEDFAQLAKDYSEGPGADKGGEVPQVITPQDFGPVLGPKVVGLPVGGITEPLREGSRFIVFKILERVPAPNGSVTGIRVAQIVIKIRPGEAASREQDSEMRELRARAKRIGLGKAAAEKGLSTRKTETFDYNNPPQSLFATPEAGEWGVSAKVGDISPVFSGPDELLIAEVSQQRPAGAPPREELTEPLRNISELVSRVEASKPRADSVAQALKAGLSLEQVAKKFGLAAFRVDGVTRMRPDPRLSASDDLTGALFAAMPGRVVGPYRALNGWFFGRVESRSLPDSAAFDTLRSQLSSQILGQRQRNFMNGYMAELRAKAKVEDLRVPSGE